MITTRLRSVLAAVALATTAAAVAATPPPGSEHSVLDQLLRLHVRDGKVDYAGIRQDEGALTTYLDQMSRVDVDSLGDLSKLAYYLNIYNATMLSAVVDRQGADPKWTPAADDFAVFKFPLVRLRGRIISLNDLEHGVIRKQFKDPRVHAALNCAAESCPPLLSRAYRAGDIEEVLEENMKRFVNDPARNPIDVRNRKLVLSKIFEWYADDFGGMDKIAAYVDKYHDADTRGWPVSFIEYSWKLNDAAGAN